MCLKEIIKRLKKKEPELDLIVNKLEEREAKKVREVAGVKFYLVEEVAEALNTTPTTVRAYINAKKLKAKKIAGKWIILEEDLKKLLLSEE